MIIRHLAVATLLIAVPFAALQAADSTISDVDPELFFDDTDPADATAEWRIEGWNEHFNIIDDADSDKVVIGVNAATDSINIGYNSVSSGSLNLALGVSANAEGDNSVALGRAAHSIGDWSQALGRQSVSTGIRSTALGYTASSVGEASLAAGQGAGAMALQSMALGVGTIASGEDSVAIGNSAIASGAFGFAIGATAFGEGATATAVGYAAHSNGDYSIALGYDAYTEGGDSVALGAQAQAIGDASIALGRLSNAGAGRGIAIGESASSTGPRSLALGNNALAATQSSIAIGDEATTPGYRGVALGYSATVTNGNATAIGNLAQADQEWSVVLGAIAGVNDAVNYSNVGIGSTDPLAPLHVFRDDVTQEFLYLESNEAGGPQDRAMMYLVNNGGIRFEFANPSLGTAWRFQAATGNQDNFEVTKVGTGEIEFRVDAAGNAYLKGILNENSDRDAKTGITPVDASAILDKVAALPIASWRYKDSPDTTHIGPMAQDFRAAFGTGDSDTSLSSIDTSGVALAAIQGLQQQVVALQREVSALRARLAD